MIELRNTTFGYKKRPPLFRELDLALTAGHVYGLLGKNGSGKSTLLHLISGLLFAQTGTISVLGHDARNRAPELLSDTYLVPEDFELPAVSVKIFVANNAVFYPHFKQHQFDKYLEEFEVSGNSLLTSLSYGQQKKFLISFGMATNARLLILDEPTNGLDIPSKRQFRKTVASWLEEDRSVIVSTHQVRDLENLIDAVVIMEKGQIIFNHTLLEIEEKLVFENDVTQVPEEEIVYSESQQGRRIGIARNVSAFESKADLELLFNAAITDHLLLQSQF